MPSQLSLPGSEGVASEESSDDSGEPAQLAPAKRRPQPATGRGRRSELERKLKREQLLIERSARSRGEFFANLSHEIRTPINSILGMTAVVMETSLSEEQLEHMRTIRSAGEFLLTLVNDILDYSKIEAGKTSLSLERFNPAVLAQNLLNLIAPHLNAKSLEYSLEVLNPGPDKLLGDSARIGQIIVNLLGNAAKFTPAGGSIRLILDTRPLGSDRHELHLEVRDTGVGIPSDKLDTIFDSYTQVECPSCGPQSGSGLGLAISKRLVTLMGGQIGVYSKPGSGSSFWFQVPLILPVDSPQTAANQDVLRRLPARPLKILLAEDHPINQKLVVMLLEKRGFEVTVASDGREAVQKFADGQYDVVLMDWQMPILNGIQAAKQIREIETDRSIRTPIIAMTAHASVEDRDVCLQAGMDDYISKPVRPERLFETVLRVASRPAV